MLENEELLEYIRLAQKGNAVAKEYVFKQNTPLLRSIVRRFKDKGVEYDDLYQIACVGFIKAINNFNESFEVKFSTYCVPMVIGEIKRYIRDNGAIKVSRTLKILANKINRYIDEYQSHNSDSPSIEHLSKVFSIEQDEVVIALESSRMPVSIYDKFEDEDDGQELIDKIPSVDNEEKIINRLQLTDVMANLTERERKIIILRFFRDRTQSEVAEELGVSQVQISRLEGKIIDKIRLKF